MSILDYIKEGKLPELPISFDRTSIIYIAVGLFLMALTIVLIVKLLFKK